MEKEHDESAVLSRCCVCARARMGDGWQAVAPELPGERVSHTYCPECLASVSPRRRTSGRAMLVRGPLPASG
jgi:hypothetical protein